MNRRHFLKSLVAIPFLGFFKFEDQPVAKLDLIIEGMEASGSALLEQTEPVIEAIAKQTVYFTPYPSSKMAHWNGQSWSQVEAQLKEGKEGEVYIFGGLDEVITTGHKQ